MKNLIVTLIISTMLIYAQSPMEEHTNIKKEARTSKINKKFKLVSSKTKKTRSKKKRSKKRKKRIEVKQRIKCNMTVKYLKKPKNVDSLKELFTKGILYGRIRINNFSFDAGSAGQSHRSLGVGGNLIYKSARLNGLAFTTGLYTSQNPFPDDVDLKKYRYGKDTFSRRKVANGGGYSMTALAENYISYKERKANLKVGRFLLESFLLQSHDTKMIPNAFEGAALEIKSIPKTKIQMAYITKQKQRDHEQFHRAFAYGENTPDDPFGVWSQNDDGAMHRGITASKLDALGIDDKIMLIEAKNRGIKNLTLRSSYTTLPHLVSSLMVEGTYQMNIADFKIKPSVRYMKQFDNGAGAIGGANLRTNTIGYANPNDLNSALFAARVDIIKGNGSLRMAYSKIADKGDIIASWQAQPTNGYTRPMSGMNWYANTQTIMFRGDYDLGKADIIPNFKIMSRYTMNNYDDKKPGTTSDTNILTVDLIKHYKKYPNLLTKLRSIFVREDHKVSNKIDPSYNALRLEMDYLF